VEVRGQDSLPLRRSSEARTLRAYDDETPALPVIAAGWR